MRFRDDPFELVMPCNAPPELHDVPDTDVLALATQCQVAENANRARKLLAFAELYQRCQREYAADCERARQPQFVPTALEAMTAELAPLLSMSEETVWELLDLYTKVSAWFPLWWKMCLDGRMDLNKMRILVQSASALKHAEDIAKFAALMDKWLSKTDDPDSPISPITWSQMNRAARYRKNKFEQRDDEETFNEAFQKRKVMLRIDDTGVGSLTMRHAGHELTAADYRLTLIAKKLRDSDGEDRNLDQLRADAMLGLVLGTLTVDALDSELEEDVTADGTDPAEKFHRHAPGAFARAVVYVTVPVQSLMGLDDEPGYLSGDNPIPADLARYIAADPGSTWYRLLTDPAGNFAELSTHSYRPTAPIARTVLAKQRTCIWPGCCRPAATCELDHRIEWPAGHTCPDNLEPLCKRHHRLKHAEGFTVIKQRDGGYLITTRRGQIFRTRPSEQPVGRWPDVPAA